MLPFFVAPTPDKELPRQVIYAQYFAMTHLLDTTRTFALLALLKLSAH